MRFHFERTVFLCPIFKSQVHGAGTQVRTADSNLANLSEFFAFFVQYFSGMNFVRKIGDFFLFVDIELPFVCAVRHHVLSELTSCKVMENHSLFARVHDLAVIKSLEFFKKLRLVGQILQRLQNLFVHLFCPVIISQAFRHRNRIFPNASNSILGRKFILNRNHAFE